MDHRLHLEDILRKETLPNAFKQLDEIATKNFWSFFSALVNDLVDEDVSMELRNAASSEICRMMSMPSKLHTEVMKEKWNEANEDIKNSIQDKMFQFLNRMDFRHADLVHSFQRALTAVIVAGNLDLVECTDKILNISNKPDSNEFQRWASVNVIGNIFVSRKAPIDSSHLANLVKTFKKCLVISNLERVDVAYNRIHSTLCSLANVIECIEIDPTTDEMYDGYNDCFSIIITEVLDSDGILKGSATVCIAAVSLLKVILSKQKKYCANDLNQIRQFWKRLVASYKLRLLSVMSANIMGIENGSKIVENFFNTLDSL